MRYIGFVLAVLVTFLAPPAPASILVNIKSFCTGTCTDGQDPEAPLLRDASGTLYGTAKVGGAHQHGVVFSLTPSMFGANIYNYSVLYSFCPSTPDCSGDGGTPLAGLIIDSSGNLYGTTSSGGAHSGGVVFELVKPSMPSGDWSLVQIYSFCSVVVSSVCTDGEQPMSKLTYSGAESGVPYDGTSMLFGTTFLGGASSGPSTDLGTVYALHLSGRGNWSEKAIIQFNSANGSKPETGLVMDATTNILWGTTQGGGSALAGVAFKLVPGSNLWTKPWTETVIYNFCWALSNPCTDGRGPGGVVRDSSGNLFGAALDGGGGSSPGNGMIFELANGNCTENGVSGFWCNTALFDFCAAPTCASPNPNGTNPSLTSDLAIDSSGNLFGTTTAGGNASNGGIVYELSGTTETVLHNFCSSSSCTDGNLPLAGVILDSNGNIYGTTSEGGSGSPASGTAFKITP
jgi:uncharacterized repeat protein (TIGR03803 family)